MTGVHQPGAGDVIADRYRIDRVIGVGGMGSVFEAHDLTNGQRCAIKMLHPVLQRQPVLQQRFLREAAAARVLMTPHAVKVEATGNLAGGLPYIVMEYLDGEELGKYAAKRGGKLPIELALSLADQVAAAIHEAHARGILHRDLKPENIFVLSTPQGDVIKVVDFGISKIFTEEGVKLTLTGMTVGTPQYMPVEQLRGTKGLDGRVDVYALGVILYELLSGIRPYDGFTYEEVILKVATTTAPPIGTYYPSLPPGLAAVIDRAIARDRDQRFLSMADLRGAMSPFWSGRCPLCGMQNNAPPSQSNPGMLPVSQRGSSASQPGPEYQGNLAVSGAWGPVSSSPPSGPQSSQNAGPVSTAFAPTPISPAGSAKVPSLATILVVMLAASMFAVALVAVVVALWLALH